MSKTASKQQQATGASPTAQSTPTSPTSTNSPMDHQLSNQVIHVRGDSDSKLEELFKAVMNPSGSLVPLTLPMRQRKFPASFFNPPDKGSRTPASHSRESSTDSTAIGSSSNGSGSSEGNSNGASGPQQQQANSGGSVGGSSSPGGAPPQHPGGLAIQHNRAHSSPASLQQTFASAPNIQHQHLRQQSYDITDDTPLPPGWGMAKTNTGQRYFLNHLTQTTTWDDPRKKMNLNASSAVSLGHIASGGSSAASTPTPSPTPTPTTAINPLSIQNLGPLPDGLEQASTPEGEVYFINHITRTTSWFDPRIPMHLQRPVRNINQLPPSMNASTGGTNNAGVAGNAGNSNSNNSGGSGSAALPPLPSPSSTNDGQFSIQQRQQQVRLQRLQMERERLQLRQREIMMQEMLMQQHIIDALPPTSPAMDIQPSLSTTGLDPFLSSSNSAAATGSSTDFHSRQESADSGLGMGNSYSHPHTPEGFLSPMDDSSMDIATEAQLAAADLGNLDLGESTNMDSDDLEPSLQVELGNELLDVDVQDLLNTNRMDNVLTWL